MYQENFYEDMVKFGEALRILRKRKNLTQNDMARIAGIDRKHLSDVELGKHKAGLELALILCVALGVNRFELFALAWEEDYKIYRQKVLQEEAEKQCTSDLTKCFFFFSTIQLRMGIIGITLLKSLQ